MKVPHTFQIDTHFVWQPEQTFAVSVAQTLTARALILQAISLGLAATRD